MSGYKFSEEETAAVTQRFPKLKPLELGAWKGTIDIDAVHEGERIVDSFEVAIGASDKYPDELPFLVELGGRIKAIAEKYKITDLRDLHVNPRTGVACLCVKQEEKSKFPPGSTLVDFIDDLVVPYLYWLSFYDKHGKGPWGEYSHGGIGLLEYYAEASNVLTKDEIEEVATVFKADDNWKWYAKQIKTPSGTKSCVCGSGKPIEKCEPAAWKGIQRLNADLKRLGLNPYKLYRR